MNFVFGFQTNRNNKKKKKRETIYVFQDISFILLISTYVNFIFCGHLHVLCNCLFQFFFSLSFFLSLSIIINIIIIIRNKNKAFLVVKKMDPFFPKLSLERINRNYRHEQRRLIVLVCWEKNSTVFLCSRWILYHP